MRSCEDTPISKYALRPLCPFAKPLFRKLFRIKVFGSENIPKHTSYIVASNHRSHLDPPVLNACFPEPLVFLAKEDLFKPPIGWILKHMRAIPLKRSSEDIDTLGKVISLLENGCPVAIFPEGTRARPGEFLRPKPGVGLLAIKSKAPVVPVLIEGTDKVFPRGSKIPKPLYPIQVYIGKPLTFPDLPDKPAGYKEVARTVMETIKRLK